MQRLSDLDAFYNLLTQLEGRIGGRRLGDCDKNMDWSKRGVYFFFEPNQNRNSGNERRVVHIGTHAISKGSKKTIWNRLAQIQGTKNPYGGKHRSAVLRKYIGEALINRNPSFVFEHWGKGESASPDIVLSEQEHEARVSDYIGEMTLLFVSVLDEPSSRSLRNYIKQNSLALLSNYLESTPDQPSKDWLGHHSSRDKVRLSGLWNNRHVDKSYDPDFLNVFEDMIKQT